MFLQEVFAILTAHECVYIIEERFVYIIGREIAVIAWFSTYPVVHSSYMGQTDLVSIILTECCMSP